MRFVFAFAVLLFAAPVLAADWGEYVNSRYGFVVGVPPGFTGQGESDNGDGQVFRSRDGAQKLTVWGGFLTDGDFSSEMQARLADDAGEGWTITYQASTPQWISYSGTRQGSVIYARGIARCSDQYAMFRLQYPTADMSRLDAIVEKLVRSLKAGQC